MYNVHLNYSVHGCISCNMCVKNLHISCHLRHSSCGFFVLQVKRITVNCVAVCENAEGRLSDVIKVVDVSDIRSFGWCG